MKFPRLSLDLPGKKDGLSCQKCGSTAELKRWEECDDTDKPEGIFVTLCASCSDSIIGPHARLYMPIERRPSRELTLPDEWFEDTGVKLTDSVKAIFLHDGKPMLGLFIRHSTMSTAPMAVSSSGNISLIVECDIKGIFQKTVHLILQDKDGKRQSLRIPLTSLAQGFDDTAVKFLAWAHVASPVLQTMGVPSYMFARNIELKL